jgi:hypothetical protein
LFDLRIESRFHKGQLVPWLFSLFRIFSYQQYYHLLSGQVAFIK